MDHVLSELSTMTLPSWWPYTAWLSFIELDKAVVHMIRLAENLHYSLHFFVDLDYLTAFKVYIPFDPISLLTGIYSTDMLT